VTQKHRPRFYPARLRASVSRTAPKRDKLKVKYKKSRTLQALEKQYACQYEEIL
jgi:hypothetical protein